MQHEDAKNSSNFTYLLKQICFEIPQKWYIHFESISL